LFFISHVRLTVSSGIELRAPKIISLFLKAD